MTLVFFGTGAFGLPALEALLGSPHRVLAVVTAPEKPRGRHLKKSVSEIKSWATAHGLPVLEFSRGDESGLQKAIKRLGPDALVVISFGVILKEDLLKLPALGALNVHSSLLPRYRGAAPIRRALLNGEQKTGVTVMRMTARLDAGDILIQKNLSVDPEENAVGLEKRLAFLGAEALLESLKSLEDKTARFVPQNESEATYAAKIVKEEGRIDWAQGAEAVLNRVRAMAGWPGAFTFLKGKRLVILEARKAAETSKAQAPGKVDVGLEKNFLKVAVSDGWVELTHVQLESKKALTASEFLKGTSLQSGDFLE